MKSIPSPTITPDSSKVKVSLIKNEKSSQKLDQYKIALKFYNQTIRDEFLDNFLAIVESESQLALNLLTKSDEDLSIIQINPFILRNRCGVYFDDQEGIGIMFSKPVICKLFKSLFNLPVNEEMQYNVLSPEIAIALNAVEDPSIEYMLNTERLERIKEIIIDQNYVPDKNHPAFRDTESITIGRYIKEFGLEKGKLFNPNEDSSNKPKLEAEQNKPAEKNEAMYALKEPVKVKISLIKAINNGQHKIALEFDDQTSRDSFVDNFSLYAAKESINLGSMFDKSNFDPRIVHINSSKGQGDVGVYVSKNNEIAINLGTVELSNYFYISLNLSLVAEFFINSNALYFYKSSVISLKANEKASYDLELNIRQLDELAEKAKPMENKIVVNDKDNAPVIINFVNNQDAFDDENAVKLQGEVAEKQQMEYDPSINYIE